MIVRIKFKLFAPLAFCVGICLTLVSLELFLRLNPRFGYIYDDFKVQSDLGLNNFSYLRSSAILGYEHIPNYDLSREFKINAYGLLGSEYRLEKDTGIFRILILGDSIAEQGWSIKFLEGRLNNSLKLKSRYNRFELWNAGVASYDVRRYALFLKYKGLAYNPDMVIVYLFMNDFALNTNIYYRTKNGHISYFFHTPEISKRYIPSPFLLKTSHLYRFIILKLDSYLSSKKNHNIDPLEENGRYYLGVIKDLCERNNIPLFIVIFPYLKPLSEYDSRERNEYQTICKVVRELAVLNLHDYVPEGDLYSLRCRETDDIHWSLEGNRIIAKSIYTYLVNNFFEAKSPTVREIYVSK